MELEQLGKLLYETIPAEHKKNLGAYLRTKPLNILKDCETSDIEYEKVDSSLSPKIEQPSNKQSIESSVRIYNNVLDIEEQFIMRDGSLYTKEGNIKVGIYKNWQFDTNVPRRYCDSDGNVLYPDNNQPIIEYTINNPACSLYDDYQPDRVYRPYIFDYYMNRFIKTGDVRT